MFLTFRVEDKKNKKKYILYRTDLLGHHQRVFNFRWEVGRKVACLHSTAFLLGNGTFTVSCNELTVNVP